MTGVSPASADQPSSEDLGYLRLLERAATVASQSSGLEEAAGPVLEAVCAYTGWPVGHLYVVADSGDRSGPVLEPRPIWHLHEPERFAALRANLDATPLGPGDGLPGRVLATGRPAWIDDLEPEDHGLRAAFGLPVLVGHDVVAVLEFFADDPRPLDGTLIERMTGVGYQLARVAERAQAASALRQAEDRYRALAESAPDSIVSADPKGLVLSFNRAAERTFGYTEEEVRGCSLTMLVPARFQPALLDAIDRVRSSGRASGSGRPVELAGMRRDGSEFPLELSLSSWDAGGGTSLTGIIRDVSDRRQAERQREAFEHQLAQKVLHDNLTGLPNRALLRDRLEQAVARAARRETGVAVLTVDLDRFKTVNDRYGHHIGDLLLVAVASRLQSALRPDDTVARIGVDQFAILCEDVSDRGDVLVFAERIVEALSRPFSLNQHDLSVSASVGAALGVGATARPDRLLRDAELALEQARQRGHGKPTLYEESMRIHVTERLAVEQDLSLAIDDGQLRLCYQPIVELETAQLSGVEALIRWEHPTRGTLAPQHFIGPAEDSGLIVPLGRWVLEEACRQGATWQKSLGGAAPLRVSVNVSAKQFQQPQWTDQVAQALLASGFEPGQLVLEITESVLMKDTDTTAQRLGELRELGVRIAIDDFGTGYSSLGYLRKFPVDILKVDKSFIDGVAEGPHESALARAVIKLAATLHLDAVAEGVTSRRQLATLRRLRCRFAQGYYFARPQPAEGINAILARPLPAVDGADELSEGVLEAPPPLPEL